MLLYGRYSSNSCNMRFPRPGMAAVSCSPDAVLTLSFAVAAVLVAGVVAAAGVGLLVFERAVFVDGVSPTEPQPVESDSINISDRPAKTTTSLRADIVFPSAEICLRVFAAHYTHPCFLLSSDYTDCAEFRTKGLREIVSSPPYALARLKSVESV